MKWLNYHHLIYFREIASSGSISKASEKLLIGQPALSAQLKQFEDELQIELFERKNRKLILTDAGKVVLKYANEISRLGQELITVVENKSYSTKSNLKIGALESIPKQIVWEITQKARSFGDYFISIVEGSHQELTDSLLQRNIDCFITNYQADFSLDKNISGKSYVKVSISVYGTKAFLNCRKNFPQSLRSMPIILPGHQSKLRHDLDDFFNFHNLKISCELETQDTSLMKIFALEGAGLAILPDIAVVDLVSEKKLFKIGVIQNVKEEYWIISSKRTIDNPVATHLLNSI